MGRYNVLAKLDQIVTKEIKLLVVGGSEEEAMEKARAALNEYPKPVNEPSVQRVITNKAQYWVPRSIEFVRVEEDTEDA